MQRAFEACKPGGYIESFEPSSYLESEDRSVMDTMAMGQWGKLFIEGGREMGRSFEVYQHGTVRAALESAGFVDLHEQNFKGGIFAFRSVGILARNNGAQYYWLTAHAPSSVPEGYFQCLADYPSAEK